jgi:hypothetical protein
MRRSEKSFSAVPSFVDSPTEAEKDFSPYGATVHPKVASKTKAGAETPPYPERQPLTSLLLRSTNRRTPG